MSENQTEPRARFFSEVRNALALSGAADPEAAATLFVSEHAPRLKFDERTGRVSMDGKELTKAFGLNPALTQRFRSADIVEMTHAEFDQAVRSGRNLNLGKIRLIDSPRQAWKGNRK